MTENTIIQVKGLKTRFGKQLIHDGLDFEVFRGEVFGIVGASGSGKSVLLRFLIGLERPQEGRVHYLLDTGRSSNYMGVLFQSGALLSSLTVLENVMLPLKEVAQLSHPLAQELALFKIQQVGLPLDSANKYPAQISGGMVKRAGLARALALNPELVFLDEPTAGLDPISAEGFDQLILNLQKELSITVVMVTHDLDSLAQICNRIAVLVDRRAIVGSIKEISKLSHPWIQRYFHGKRGERIFGSK